MILTPYIIASNEPVKMRYMKLREAPSVTSSSVRDYFLTVDILPKESALHVLLSHPDWYPRGLANDIENICSSLLMLMDLNGLVKARNQVFWYELSFFSYPEIVLHSVHFTDNGHIFSNPSYKSLPFEQSPFNISAFTNSEFKSSDFPQIEKVKNEKKREKENEKKDKGTSSDKSQKKSKR